METVHKSALVPYSAARMYALVNDIEAYPQFLPWCSDARVLERGDRRVTASVTIALSGLHQTFTTENTLEPDRRIEVRLVSGPFRRLHGQWSFEPVAADQCKVGLEMSYEFKNRALQLAFGKIFTRIVNSFVDVFRQRAGQIHGSHA